jgi:hypothetical protein
VAFRHSSGSVAVGAAGTMMTTVVACRDWRGHYGACRLFPASSLGNRRCRSPRAGDDRAARSIIGYYCGVARTRSLETLVVYSDSAPMILGGAACCAPKVDPDALCTGPCGPQTPRWIASGTPADYPACRSSGGRPHARVAAENNSRKSSLGTVSK